MKFHVDVVRFECRSGTDYAVTCIITIATTATPILEFDSLAHFAQLYPFHSFVLFLRLPGSLKCIFATPRRSHLRSLLPFISATQLAFFFPHNHPLTTSHNTQTQYPHYQSAARHTARHATITHPNTTITTKSNMSSVLPSLCFSTLCFGACFGWMLASLASMRRLTEDMIASRPEDMYADWARVMRRSNGMEQAICVAEARRL